MRDAQVLYGGVPGGPHPGRGSGNGNSLLVLLILYLEHFGNQTSKVRTLLQ